MKATRRAGIYVRVSTQDQSTELQVRELIEYARSRGWEPTLYDDTGKSGTTSNRPMLKQLMLDARRRKLDVIVTWKLDRLFRSLKDLVVILQEFKDLGLDFVSLKDQIDLSTSSGRLMMQMLGAFAEFEASLIKERVRAGLRNARAKGKVLGRPRRRDDAKIISMRAGGNSVRKIAKELKLSKSVVG